MSKINFINFTQTELKPDNVEVETTALDGIHTGSKGTTEGSTTLEKTPEVEINGPESTEVNIAGSSTNKSEITWGRIHQS